MHGSRKPIGSALDSFGDMAAAEVRSVVSRDHIDSVSTVDFQSDSCCYSPSPLYRPDGGEPKIAQIEARRQSQIAPQGSGSPDRS